MNDPTNHPPLLVPAPRQLHLTGDIFDLPATGLIAIDGPDVQALLFSARQLQDAAWRDGFTDWKIVAGKAAPPHQIAATLSVVPGAVPHEQGYALTITPERIDAVAASPAGVFYAVQTIRQLLLQYGEDTLPTLRIVDWPDFPTRGVMLDISRDKVPTMDTLFALVDMLPSWKVNQLQLYTEHTFAYHRHPAVWADASPLTGEQILALDAYCRQRYVELVPNQNTFGHLHRWLKHPEYIHLAEAPEGSLTPWGGLWWEGPYSVSPAHPGSLDLVRDMLDELLPHFGSQQVNVGCDETFDLGQGLSKELVAEQGVGRVYLDFLLKIYREVKARGKTMQFWGDIIMEHPELVPELPRDAIALEWGYEADHPFDEHGALFAASGIPFYVCPGTSSWRTLAGRTDNAVANLRSAAENGRKHGAVGYLNTDWGDSGHWQPLPVSYPGFLYGAAVSWSLDANADLDLAAALDHFVFKDDAGVMGGLLLSLGNIYQEPGILVHNSSVLFNALQSTPAEIRQHIVAPHGATELRQRLQATLARIDEIIAPVLDASMAIADADVVSEELAWVTLMLQHACARILWVIDGQEEGTAELLQAADYLIEVYGEIWHARNRPGGFEDSVARLQRMRDAYLAS